MGQIRAATRSTASVVGWTLLFLALVTGISLLGLYWSGWFSGPAGAVGVQIQNNDANNRITAASNFNKLWGDIQGYEQTIRHSDPADADVHAAEQECGLAVGQYNAMLSNPTTKDWLPQGDPAEPIPLTDCYPE